MNNFPGEGYKRYCEWDGNLIPKRDSINWYTYSKRRFCSQLCSSAWRRAQPCPQCGGQNWYESPTSGKRACRTCKGRSANDRRKAKGYTAPSDLAKKRKKKVSTFEPVAPVKVDIPAAPPPESPPVWRPAIWIELEKRKAEKKTA